MVLVERMFRVDPGELQIVVLLSFVLFFQRNLGVFEWKEGLAFWNDLWVSMLDVVLSPKNIEVLAFRNLRLQLTVE